MIAWCQRSETFVKRLSIIALCFFESSCALLTRQNARGVLDVVQTVCVIENATLGDAQVAQVCGVADELMPVLRNLLAKQRAQLARARDEGEYAAASRAAAQREREVQERLDAHRERAGCGGYRDGGAQ